MSAYNIKYTESPNAIPTSAIKLQREMDNIGTVYLFHHQNKTDIYLNYSIGMKIDKPVILKVDEKGGKVNIDVRRSEKAIKNKVNYHCFKLEFSKKINEVHLMEYI